MDECPNGLFFSSQSVGSMMRSMVPKFAVHMKHNLIFILSGMRLKEKKNQGIKGAEGEKLAGQIIYCTSDYLNIYDKQVSNSC